MWKWLNEETFKTNWVLELIGGIVFFTITTAIFLTLFL